jgi:hypothetical protein
MVLESHLFEKLNWRADWRDETLSPFVMRTRNEASKESKDEKKEDKFDKNENIRVYQTLSFGSSLTFEGVDAQVVEGPTKIQRSQSDGEVVNDYRIKIKALASTACLRIEYLDATLHEIKVSKDGPIYQVIIFLFSGCFKDLLIFLLSLDM